MDTPIPVPTVFLSPRPALVGPPHLRHLAEAAPPTPPAVSEAAVSAGVPPYPGFAGPENVAVGARQHLTPSAPLPSIFSASAGSTSQQHRTVTTQFHSSSSTSRGGGHGLPSSPKLMLGMEATESVRRASQIRSISDFLHPDESADSVVYAGWIGVDRPRSPGTFGTVRYAWERRFVVLKSRYLAVCDGDEVDSARLAGFPLEGDLVHVPHGAPPNVLQLISGATHGGANLLLRLGTENSTVEIGSWLSAFTHCAVRLSPEALVFVPHAGFMGELTFPHALHPMSPPAVGPSAILPPPSPPASISPLSQSPGAGGSDSRSPSATLTQATQTLSLVSSETQTGSNDVASVTVAASRAASTSGTHTVTFNTLVGGDAGGGSSLAAPATPEPSIPPTTLLSAKYSAELDALQSALNRAQSAAAQHVASMVTTSLTFSHSGNWAESTTDVFSATASSSQHASTAVSEGESAQKSSGVMLEVDIAALLPQGGTHSPPHSTASSVGTTLEQSSVRADLRANLAARGREVLSAVKASPAGLPPKSPTKRETSTSASSTTSFQGSVMYKAGLDRVESLRRSMGSGGEVVHSGRRRSRLVFTGSKGGSGPFMSPSASSNQSSAASVAALDEAPPATHRSTPSNYEEVSDMLTSRSNGMFVRSASIVTEEVDLSFDDSSAVAPPAAQPTFVSPSRRPPAVPSSSTKAASAHHSPSNSPTRNLDVLPPLLPSNVPPPMLLRFLQMELVGLRETLSSLSPVLFDSLMNASHSRTECDSVFGRLISLAVDSGALAALGRESAGNGGGTPFVSLPFGEGVQSDLAFLSAVVNATSGAHSSDSQFALLTSRLHRVSISNEMLAVALSRAAASAIDEPSAGFADRNRAAILAFYAVAAPEKATEKQAATAREAYGPDVWTALTVKYGEDLVAPFAAQAGFSTDGSASSATSPAASPRGRVNENRPHSFAEPPVAATAEPESVDDRARRAGMEAQEARRRAGESAAAATAASALPVGDKSPGSRRINPFEDPERLRQSIMEHEVRVVQLRGLGESLSPLAKEGAADAVASLHEVTMAIATLEQAIGVMKQQLGAILVRPRAASTTSRAPAPAAAPAEPAPTAASTSLVLQSAEYTRLMTMLEKLEHSDAARAAEEAAAKAAAEAEAAAREAAAAEAAALAALALDGDVEDELRDARRVGSVACELRRRAAELRVLLDVRGRVGACQGGDAHPGARPGAHRPQTRRGEKGGGGQGGRGGARPSVFGAQAAVVCAPPASQETGGGDARAACSGESKRGQGGGGARKGGNAHPGARPGAARAEADFWATAGGHGGCRGRCRRGESRSGGRQNRRRRSCGGGTPPANVHHRCAGGAGSGDSRAGPGRLQRDRGW